MLSNYLGQHTKASMKQRDQERVFFLKNFLNLINKYDYFVLFNHVGPDGDCLGCSFGMQEIIRTNFPNKKAYVVGSNFGLYPWMDMKFDDVINYDFPFENAMALIMDVGQSNRIQLFDKFFKNAKVNFGAVVKIDHHGYPSDFHIDLSWDDPTYVAACCQIIQIADYYGWTLTPRAASFLYLGTCTDSLRFSVDNVLPRSLVLAAKSWRAGADYINIHRRLNRRTWAEIEFANYLLNKATRTENIIWCIVTSEELQQHHISHAKGLVSIFQDIDGLWFWMLFIESGDMYDVDIRSVFVSSRDLATKYGGGGHENAAGCKIPKSKLEDITKDAEDIVANAKHNETRRQLLTGEEDAEAQLQKERDIKGSHQEVEKAKDLLREVRNLKDTDWESK